MLSFGGGVDRHFAYGSVADYTRGSNDFPVTPVHAPPLAGLAFGRAAGRFLFEVEARWIGTSRFVLEDPSDGDSVEVQSSAHVTAALNAAFLFLSGSIRPYVGGGGGIDVVLARDASYTSRNGFIIDVPAPSLKDRFDPEAHAGGGLFVFLGEALGLRLDVRYVWVFDKPATVRSVQAAANLTVRF